jgi:hypothetical protein
VAIFSTPNWKSSSAMMWQHVLESQAKQKDFGSQFFLLLETFKFSPVKVPVRYACRYCTLELTYRLSWLALS